MTTITKRDYNSIVCFADDIAIVSVAKTVRVIEDNTNAVIQNVGARLNETGLTLAAHKTEACTF